MAEATALVLAGGRSARMGRDKRLLLADGKTLLQRTFELARTVCGDAKVLIADPEERERIEAALRIGPSPHADSSDARTAILADSRPQSGPLTAVRDAAAHCTKPWVLVLAVDYPALTAGFLKGLLKRADQLDPRDFALVPSSDGHLQYTCALYLRRALSELARQDDAPSSFRAWLHARVDVVVWHESEWTQLAPPEALVNWNRPGDWIQPQR